uniref:Uncharacterized protein n=1 Tax=Oryza nivara TaxID=4536 RepID=A0A0E0H7Z7_ORYNI
MEPSAADAAIAHRRQLTKLRQAWEGKTRLAWMKESANPASTTTAPAPTHREEAKVKVKSPYSTIVVASVVCQAAWSDLVDRSGGQV